MLSRLRACILVRMAIVLAGISALETWRSVALSARLTDAPRCSFPQRLSTSGADAQRLAKSDVDVLEALSYPICVCAPRGAARLNTRLVKSSVLASAVPADCVFKVADGIYVCAPELAFLQLASTLPFFDLMHVGFEFCGFYRVSPDAPRGMVSADPLTSVDSLRSFVDRSSRAHGRAVAGRVARYVLDGSASPMETQLALVLTLPQMLGGYALEPPVLNFEVSSKLMAGRLVGSRFHRCDLYWPRIRLALEYDSEAEHSGPDEVGRDSRRRAALSHGGITVHTVTRSQIASVPEMERIARIVSKALGKRPRKGSFDVTDERLELRNWLFNRVRWPLPGTWRKSL